MPSKIPDAASARSRAADGQKTEPDASFTSEQLLAGRRECSIVHGSDRYRLRLTGNNKLILTK